MKKIKRFSKSKYLIIINLFLILTLMTASVYAWFASMVDNRVDVYDIQVEADTGLELSFDQTNWSGTLNLANLKDDGKFVLDTMKMVEITGDGENFWIPQLEQHENYASVDTTSSGSTTTENTHYLKFKVFMRSKSALDVYLSSASLAEPACGVDTSKLLGNDCVRPSGYGIGENEFSKDFVVGALRVSFTNDSNTRYIWIPKPEYHLDNAVGSNEYTMTATGGVKGDGTGVETENYFWNDSFKHYYLSKDELIKNSKLNVKVFTNVLTTLPDTVEKPKLDDATATKLVSLKDADGDGVFTGEATFTVWIEGCDTEARRALVGGLFNLSIVFDSFPTNTSGSSAG